MVKSIRFGKKSPVTFSAVNSYAKREGLDFSNAVLVLLAKALDVERNDDLKSRVVKLEKFKDKVIRHFRKQGIEL